MSPNEPVVTVIIPVSPAHVSLLPDALNSIKAQTVDVARVIVVNDSQRNLFPEGQPFPLDLISTGGGKWSSVARNMALAQVKTPFVTFLDADDALTNVALELMLRAYATWCVGYVYGDAFILQGDQLGMSYALEYDRGLISRRNLHTVTALIPTESARAVGGFDETLHGWEDWEFYIRMAEAGYCGKRIPQPLITYRIDTGFNRNNSAQIGPLITYVRSRHERFVKGEFEMPCSGCGGGTNQLQPFAQGVVNMFPAPASLDANGQVPMEYIGDKVAPVTYNINGRSYAGSKSEPYFAAPPQDVERLEGLGVFRRMPMASQPNTAAVLRGALEQLPPAMAPFTKSVAPAPIATRK